MRKSKLTYQSAGVSIAANDALVEKIQRSLRRTENRHVIKNINGFAGMFRLFGSGVRYRNPVLVGCTDGVGSKVLLAARSGRVRSVGIDLVAMNVNDLITCGARPLFFLDYVALHRNDPRHTADMIAGVADGCRQAGCVLLGGETAEMPDVYKNGDFDLAGFAVGVVEQRHLITGEKIKPGDAVIGLASSGIHSNGYALVRKLFFESSQYHLNTPWAAVLKKQVAAGAIHPPRRVPRGHSQTLENVLLTPTRIYVKPILSLLEKFPNVVLGMAHITGGGIAGNLPRILPLDCRAVIDRQSWQRPAIFEVMQSMGVSRTEMYRVFNMGIGMILVTRAKSAEKAIGFIQRHRIGVRRIGVIVRGRRGVEWSA